MDIYVGNEVKHHQAMINSRLTWNLLAQSLVKEYNIPKDDNLPPGFKTLNRHLLRIFQCYNIMMQVRNTQGKKFIRQQKFLGANMVSCNIILGLPWLYVLKAYVTQKIGEFYFFSDTPFALPVQEVLAYGATKVGTLDPNTIGAVAD